MSISGHKWLNDVQWDEQGLVPVIAQDAATGDVLMFAWMNREALGRTAETGEAVYWSRPAGVCGSRRRVGHVQRVLEIRLDCDNDVVLLKIEQIGGIACHTGRRSCFSRSSTQTASGRPSIRLSKTRRKSTK